MPESVRIWGPGSLSNLGPGFDSIGVALDGIGDVVEVTASEEPGIHVLPGEGVWKAPSDVRSNTAARAAAHVLAFHHDRFPGLTIKIVKGIRPGSGLGSSAASAAAAALGALTVLTDLPREHAVDAALEGEAGVAGARHGDNVLPSLMGGVVLTSASRPEHFRRVPVPVPLPLAVVRPEVTVLTKEAREMLPRVVPLRDAVHNASSLAFLIDALRAGDLQEVGRAIEQDRLVEPVRARLVPGYHDILQAARDAGALGAALSGSGPALFAVCGDGAGARRVRDAMIAATQKAGHEVSGFVSSIDERGARATRRHQTENPV
ncbi:MAG: homoserine kinase [Rhodothermales bacterium]|nr:homoserine kinase [Rhodothermales bacterium]MBO6781547.1 homoserine kinase [Rhodothermales bacterium]